MTTATGLRFRLAIKRLMDVAGSTMLLLVSLGPMIFIALGIWLTMGSPVLFRQKRPGRYEQPFTLLKFRTMRPAVNFDTESLTDGIRLTRVGSWLRRLSLDELPQLLNVLIGDMSLVGPRPLLMRYLPYFTDEERIRFEVRPGITGLAQIAGRNLLAWEHRLALDIEYVRTWRLRMDIVILAKTALAVAIRRGAIEDPHSVMANLDEERRNKGSLT